MDEPTWTDILSAWATVGAAIFAFAAVLIAVLAWRTAKRTLEAAENSAHQAALTVEQMREDSAAMREDSSAATRPYLSARLVPSLAGARVWDVAIENHGRSAAYSFTMDIQAPEAEEDQIRQAARRLAKSQVMIPPGARVRAFWHMEEDEQAEPPGALGFPYATVQLRYSNLDGTRYESDPPITLCASDLGLTPMPGEGAEAHGSAAHERNQLHVLRTIARHLGELSR